jgi:hypothetical protein
MCMRFPGDLWDGIDKKSLFYYRKTDFRDTMHAIYQRTFAPRRKLIRERFQLPSLMILPRKWV